jgi:hypothetical protein
MFGFADLDYNHIKLEFGFMRLRPTRVCNDTDPFRTWMVTKMSDQSIGCVSSILGAEIMCLYGFANLLPIVFGMKPGFALLSNILVFFIVGMALVVSGTQGWPLVTVLLVQTASAISGAYTAGRCYVHEKQRFLEEKHIRVLAGKNRTLLCNFIPENVIGKMPSSGTAMIGAHIQEAVVMFCSLHPQTEFSKHCSAHTFHVLHEIICTFDDAVERFGMFKYQVALLSLPSRRADQT